MAENIVIVESPAKAKTIEKFLGKDYLVLSSFGHIRDLEKKNFGIDIENDYCPQYVVSPDKKKIVAELKKKSKSVKYVWLASDEDREGEAIAWHLKEELELPDNKIKRIVFHEITKDAILKAIKTPRDIDYNLVNAQQARRVLDRLVGFELSPVLWKKVKPKLSAGRVQSVAVRLIVEREREINEFKSISSYKVIANFNLSDNKTQIKAELPKNILKKEDVIIFLEKCKDSNFIISDITKKPGVKNPTAPFTTSTLQQEASRKMGFSVSKTMTIAQKLYEAGKITYMRTDSVNLSDLALNTAKQVIIKEFGEEYYKRRQYKTKSKGAQEAHEAIRPTYINTKSTNGNNDEQRLYELIWKRTVASQMSEAKFEKTSVTIDISKTQEKFIASGEVLIFDGFLKVYLESSDNDKEDNNKGILPPMKTNDKLQLINIIGTEKFSYHSARYTEASLVRKLEDLGIGRPSTYAPTISTVQTRGYVVKEDREGVERKYNQVLLENNNISETIKKEITGAEKSKMFPTDIGLVVNDFLVKYFENIMDYNFTANIEKEFDEIAFGKMQWTKMVDNFYKPFHTKVENTVETSERNTGERVLGNDPATGRTIIVRIGRYGPMAQIGNSDEEDKPKFAALRKNQHLETITLEEALDLFKLPRTIGEYENKEVVIGIGRFGPYVRHDNKFYSLKKDIDDPMTIELNRAIELIEEKRKKDKEKVIKIFDENKDVQVLNGRWGPYIAYKKNNYRIPKTQDAKELSLEDCMALIDKAGTKKKK